MTQPVVSTLSDSAVCVLLLHHDDSERDTLRQVFFELGWTLLTADNPRDAGAILEAHPVSVVLAPQEEWGEYAGWLLRTVRRPRVAPKVILTHRFSESIALPEALERGAYDILAHPFERGEVTQVIGFAWMQWKREKERELLRVVPIRAAV